MSTPAKPTPPQLRWLRYLALPAERRSAPYRYGAGWWKMLEACESRGWIARAPVVGSDSYKFVLTEAGREAAAGTPT